MHTEHSLPWVWILTKTSRKFGVLKCVLGSTNKTKILMEQLMRNHLNRNVDIYLCKTQQLVCSSTFTRLNQILCCLLNNGMECIYWRDWDLVPRNVLQICRFILIFFVLKILEKKKNLISNFHAFKLTSKHAAYSNTASDSVGTQSCNTTELTILHLFSSSFISCPYVFCFFTHDMVTMLNAYRSV